MIVVAASLDSDIPRFIYFVPTGYQSVLGSPSAGWGIARHTHCSLEHLDSCHPMVHRLLRDNQLTYDLCDELMDGILRHFNLTMYT